MVWFFIGFGFLFVSPIISLVNMYKIIQRLLALGGSWVGSVCVGCYAGAIRLILFCLFFCCYRNEKGTAAGSVDSNV